MRANRVKSSSLGSLYRSYDSRVGGGCLGIELELAVIGGEHGQALAIAVGHPGAVSIGRVFSACSLAAFRWPDRNSPPASALAWLIVVLGRVARGVE